MLIAFAVAALALAFVSALVSWLALARSKQRIARAVVELDRSFAVVGESLRRALDAALAERRAAPAELGLVLDLDELLALLAQEAARRAETDAAAVRVEGPADEPAVGVFGPARVGRLLESASRAAGDRPFRALTVDWTYPPLLETKEDVFRSALLVPVLEAGRETGAIGAYSRRAQAFRPEHAQALEALAAETADAIATARRFAAVSGRTSAGRRASSADGPS
jgi:GAF domain-containing protein